MRVLDNIKDSKLRSIFARFLREETGNIVIPFALTIVPVLGMIGASIDYTRAFDARSRLQGAADSAALVATRNSDLSFADRKSIAEGVFNANLGELDSYATVTFALSEITSGHRVDATASIDTGLLGILGINNLSPTAYAESVQGTGKIEVAMVLDNTGSMRNDMDELRQAATDFTNIIFAGDQAANYVKAAVIPYVTSVNVGPNFDMQYMDANGDSASHGQFFRKKRIAKFDDCSVSITPPSPDLPDGFKLVEKNGCGWLRQPNKVSHFDLFDAFTNVSWKGCVEARAEPYDVLDTPPDDSNPDTLFVPYFWPDEADEFNGDAFDYDQDYIDDSPILHNVVYGYDWKSFKGNAGRRSRSILKYDNITSTFDETPPSTNGPNKACPTQLRPLTNNKDDVLSTISAMQHNFDGGTVTSIGLTWGWRVLSPGVPFTQGEPYGTPNLRKVIVMMTDGYNNIVESDGDGPLVSDYSGYGYVGGGRFPVKTISGAKDYIDGRFLTACANIKAEGILIYTVLFDVNDSATRQMYETCATSPEMAISASNTTQLNQAFINIGKKITELRLAR